MTKAHARLSASGSERWLNCTASVAEEEKYPHDGEKPAARLGTAAHALGARVLTEKGNKSCEDFLGWRILLHPETDQPVWLKPEGIKKAGGLPEWCRPDKDIFTVDSQMVGNVQMYVDLIRGLLEELDGAALEVEVHVDLSWIRVGLFGTTDAKIDQPFGRLAIVDYKNGYVTVEHENNTQLKMYALDAVRTGDHSEVDCYIVQPRAQHDEGPIRKHTYTRKELLAFVPEIQVAFDKATSKNDAEFHPGAWCGWCKASGNCKAQDTMVANEAGIDFDDLPGEDEELEVPKRRKDLQRAYEAIPAVRAWCKAVEKQVEAQMMEGTEFPGRKLVKSWSNRFWSKSAPEIQKAIVLAAKKLKLKVTTQQLLTEPELISPAAVERISKKLKVIVDAYTDRKVTGVRVVGEAAKGEAWDPTADAIKDFSDE